MTTDNQSLRILKRMLNGFSVTKLDCIKLADSTCGDKRISELRAMGYPIDDKWEHRGNKRYKRYWHHNFVRITEVARHKLYG